MKMAMNHGFDFRWTLADTLTIGVVLLLILGLEAVLVVAVIKLLGG